MTGRTEADTKNDSAGDQTSDGSGNGGGNDDAGGVTKAEKAATRASSYAGVATIDEKLTFQVQLLAYAGVRAVAGEIATQIANRLGSGSTATIIVADEPLVAAIAEYRLIAAHMEALEEELRSLKSELEPKRALTGLVPFGEITAAMAAISDVLSWFRTDSDYKGRDVDVEDALRPALLGQLAALGFTPLAMDGPLVPPDQSDSRSLVQSVRRLLTLKAQVQALAARGSREGTTGRSARSSGAGSPSEEPSALKSAEHDTAGSDDRQRTAPQDPNASTSLPLDPNSEVPLRQRATDLGAAVDTLIAGLGGGEQDKGRPAMLAAAAQACIAIDDAPAACLLQAKAKAGGHYVLRKSLFSALFGSDALSYGGGAAANFTLTDAKRSTVLLADLVFHSYPNVKFPSHVSWQIPSTLGLRDDPGFRRASPSRAAHPPAAAVSGTTERPSVPHDSSDS